MNTFVYKYPYFLNTNFLYVPRFWNTDDFEGNLSKLIKLGLEQKSIFIKLDFDTTFADGTGIKNNKELQIHINSKIQKEAKIAKKKIQYLKSYTLDLKTMGLID